MLAARRRNTPDIVAAYVADPLPSTSLEVVADLTAQLLAVNPRFHQEVTIPVQTNKPSQVLKAQDAFNAALRAILQTGPIDDGVSTQCALWVAAAGAVVVVVAVAGGIAVQTLVAVNYNWVWAYVQPGGILASLRRRSRRQRSRRICSEKEKPETDPDGGDLPRRDVGLCGDDDVVGLLCVARQRPLIPV